MIKLHTYFSLNFNFFRVDPRTKLSIALVCCILIGLVFSQLAVGQTPTGIKLRLHLKIDEAGNAKAVYDLNLPAKQYAMFKQTIGDPFYVIRSLESNMSWLEIENIDASFDDKSHSVRSNCDATGMLRTTDEGQWLLNIGTQEDGFELLDIRDGHAIFCSVADSPAGIVRNYMTVEMPQKSSKIQYDSTTGNLEYEFHPKLEAGGRTRTQFDLQAEERILSSLGKIYSTEQSDLFAAKHDFLNVGKQPVYNYRVRFRVEGYSSWSAWKRCAVVYPGQTVHDYFYPVFDVDKLTNLTGTRHAMIQSEIQYESVDGKKVDDSDARRVEILSRNEVIYSSRRDEDNLTWFEHFNLSPYILTCFTDGADPVMQQFAGQISSMANGPATSYTYDDAFKYLDTIWTCLATNKVAYQTSPTLSFDEHFGQHVKYGRDVLRNRAGTCIDLSIFWASAAESVGLNPRIVVVPGHAFPVIEMPNGQLLPIESTYMGKTTFKEAIESGFESLKKGQKDGRIIMVNIKQMKDSGIRSLDLPRLGEDVLTKWGYKFERPTSKLTKQMPSSQSTKDAETADSKQKPKSDANKRNAEDHPRKRRPRASTKSTEPKTTKKSESIKQLVGRWNLNAEVNGFKLVGYQVFNKNGKYFCEIMVTYPNGQKEKTTENGTYLDQKTHFKFDTNEGKYDQKYRWKSGSLEMYFPDLGVWLSFSCAE